MESVPSMNSIASWYQRASYWDLYSTHVIGWLVITILLMLICSYFWIAKYGQQIKENWQLMRCEPWVLPFAGWLGESVGTAENFQFCIQQILVNMMGYVLAPFQYLIAVATNSMDEIAQGIQAARTLTSNLRTNVSNLTEETLGRILNFLIPIQNMSITFMDTMQKIQGVLVSGLYTTLGTYYALQAVLGAILDFIIKILLALVIVIVGLWLTPVTWGAAATMTGVFTAIAVPMAVISVFMTEVMHIPVAGIPKLRCFSPDTWITKQVQIKNCKLGQVLSDGGKITAKLCLDASQLNMYQFPDGVVVSGGHRVLWEGKWIPVLQHPMAVRIPVYPHPYVYCLNTTTKQLAIGQQIYSDWDELWDPKILKKVLEHQHVGNGFHHATTKETIYREFNSCLDAKTLVWLDNFKKIPISRISIGQRLVNHSVVYGVVQSLGKNHTNADDVNDVMYHLLTTTGTFLINENGKEVADYNGDLAAFDMTEVPSIASERSCNTRACSATELDWSLICPPSLGYK